MFSQNTAWSPVVIITSICTWLEGIWSFLRFEIWTTEHWTWIVSSHDHSIVKRACNFWSCSILKCRECGGSVGAVSCHDEDSKVGDVGLLIYHQSSTNSWSSESSRSGVRPARRAARFDAIIEVGTSMSKVDQVSKIRTNSHVCIFAPPSWESEEQKPHSAVIFRNLRFQKPSSISESQMWPNVNGRKYTTPT